MADYTYLAVLIFAGLALFVPLSMLLFAKLVGKSSPQNKVKLDNYESSEVPIGTSRDVTNDYLEYFPLYLGFEILLVIILVWALVSYKISFAASLAIMVMGVVGFVMSLFAIKIAHVRDVSYE